MFSSSLQAEKAQQAQQLAPSLPASKPKKWRVTAAKHKFSCSRCWLESNKSVCASDSSPSQPVERLESTARGIQYRAPGGNVSSSQASRTPSLCPGPTHTALPPSLPPPALPMQSSRPLLSRQLVEPETLSSNTTRPIVSCYPSFGGCTAHQYPPARLHARTFSSSRTSARPVCPM